MEVKCTCTQSHIILRNLASMELDGPSLLCCLTLSLPKAFSFFSRRSCEFLKNNQFWWEILAKEFLFLGFAFNMSFLAKQIKFHRAGGHRAYPGIYSDYISKC